MAPLLRARTMTFSIGDKEGSEMTFSDSITEIEGATGSGVAVRENSGMPDDPEKRRKWAKSDEGKACIFEAGRTYSFHFANSYIDWSDYAIKIPGMTVHPLKWAGSDKSHKVRFFMKDVKEDKLYMVVYCRLLVGTDLEKALADEKREQELSG